MILSRFEIRKLYGKYDYDISFNKDVTLIYGMNGCGKTTLLNLVTALITGSIYKLFSYDFNRIALHYFDECRQDTADFKIVVKKSDNQMTINYKGVDHEIVEQKVPDEQRRRRAVDYIYDFYAKIYPFVSDIKHEFNYVYLSLSRAAQLSEENEDFLYRRNYFYSDGGVVEPEYIAPEIQFVESLILKKYMDVSAKVNMINNKFRNEVLKKTTNLQSYKKEEILNNIFWFDEREINTISTSYIKILEELSLVNEEEKRKYQKYFKDCIANARKKETSNNYFNLSGILQCYELTRIQEIVKIAEEAEKEKSEAHKPLNLFIDTINEFIGHSDIEKTIDIDFNGRVFFKSEGDDRRLSIQFLSSGEKQLIVFFANLIFGVNLEKTGIFVVDEPELSLHLSWQKIFIEKALEVNSNVQFIFATHAPEIVGKYRNKMKQLGRKRAN